MKGMDRLASEGTRQRGGRIWILWLGDPRITFIPPPVFHSPKGPGQPTAPSNRRLAGRERLPYWGATDPSESSLMRTPSR